MDNTKLIKLFKTFTQTEFKEFGKFLNSPFHNESLKMKKLYRYFKEYFPHFSGVGFTKENAYFRIYGNRNYEDKKLRERLSDMLSLAENYLSIINLKRDDVKIKFHTLNEFAKRNLPVHFDKKHREIFSILESEVFKNENTFYNEYLLHSKKIEFYQSSDLVGKRKAFFDEICVYIELFLRYFTTQMLQNYSVINNIKNTVNFRYENKFYEGVINYVNEYSLEKYPIIKALMLMIKINKNREDSASYFSLKKLYLKYHLKMSKSDNSMICTELLIHARKMQRAGYPEFKNESFEMLKFQIKNKTYPLENGFMKRETFLAAVDTALSLGQIEWTRSFMNDLLKEIAPELRDDIMYWCRGTIFFCEKKYEAALEQFSRVQTGDFVYYFWVKVPVSKIYYELKEFDNLLLLIDSFKHYTSANNLIPEFSRKWYGDYFNILKKLTLLNFKFDEYKLRKLTEETKNSVISSNGNNSWLLQKINELNLDYL